MLFIESILIQLFLSVLPYEIQMLMNIFLILLVYVVNWRVFLKAGEKGWKSLIPFYNEYVQYKFLKMKDLYRVVLITILYSTCVYYVCKYKKYFCYCFYNFNIAFNGTSYCLYRLYFL